MPDKISASEALYAFAAWLTSLDKPVTFSGRHAAGMTAELVGEFCKANSLEEPRQGWTDCFVYPTTRPFIDLYADEPTTPVEHKLGGE